MAATAVQVTTPKASRTTPEAFAATLGRGLAGRHAVLPLRPESLRRLDKIDAIVIDPRILCTETLRVARIRGADDSELSAAWNRAQLMLENSSLRPGWRTVRGISGGQPNSKVEALFLPAHDPLASAVVAEAHRTGAELVSVDVDSLDELRPAFDDVRPIKSGTDKSIDDALAAAVTDLQLADRTVAILSSSGAQAISSCKPNAGHQAEERRTAVECRSSVAGSGGRLAGAARAARSQVRNPARHRDCFRRNRFGIALHDPGCPGQSRLRVGQRRRGGRSVLWLPASPRDSQRRHTTPGRLHEWHAMSVAQVRKALPPPEPDRLRSGVRPRGHATERVTPAGDLAARQGRASRIVRPAHPGDGNRLGGQRGARLTRRRGAGRDGADRELDSGRRPAASGRKAVDPPFGSTDCAGHAR